MSFNTDEGGIAYALIVGVISLIVVVGTWVTLGIVVDEFNLMGDLLAGSNDIWGSNTVDGISKLNMVWDLILWISLAATGLYCIVTAIRHERSDY